MSSVSVASQSNVHTPVSNGKDQYTNGQTASTNTNGTTGVETPSVTSAPNANGVDRTTSNPSATPGSTDGSINASGTNSTTDNSSFEPEGGYPEQKHAGKIGYGPNYGQSAGFGEKMTGLKEEIKGKLTRNPELVQQGHDRRTGELKRKQEAADDTDPFAIPDDKDGEHPDKPEKEQAATVAPEGTEEAETQRQGGNVDNTKVIDE